MYMCLRAIDFVCFYDFPIVLWNCPDGVVRLNLFFILKPSIHDTSFASKSPFKFLEFKFFDRVYHTRNLNQKT